MEFQDYKSALKQFLSHVNVGLSLERIPLTEAIGRILAQDIVAKNDYPQHKTASMDGYVIKFDENIEKFRVLGELPAGHSPREMSLKSGECIKSFTGSLMPNGADTLVPVEDVEEDSGFIYINKRPTRGFAVRPVAESYAKGEMLIEKSTVLEYGEIALLAELGYSYVNVFSRAKIAILSTGSEIVDIGDSKTNEAQINSSNQIAIAAMLTKMGALAQICPVIKDDEKSLENAIISAINNADALITTGGVSMGDYDFVKHFLRKWCTVVVDGVAIKPGRHIKIAKFGGFGEHSGEKFGSKEKFIFALPGFPYSAMVTAALFVRPFIDALAGVVKEHEHEAILAEDYTKKSNLQEFSAATLINEKGVLKITCKGKKRGSSAIVNNLSNNATLLICPKDSLILRGGEVVRFVKMP